MQVACLRCLPAGKPLRRFSTQHRFPPFLPCRTPVRSISDTHPVDIGHRSGPNRTPFRSHRKTVRHQSGRLSDFNRNTVRFESERCPTSNRIGVRFASEYASSAQRESPILPRASLRAQDRSRGPPIAHPAAGSIRSKHWKRSSHFRRVSAKAPSFPEPPCERRTDPAAHPHRPPTVTHEAPRLGGTPGANFNP